MENKTVTFSKDSSNLFFHILTKCNLSCTHCYINKKQHGSNTLDIDTIKNWLKLFANKAAKTNIIFLGGEPTLHPDLHLAVKNAKKLGFKSITIDTNGYLFHNILDKISCKDIDYLSFSLDGATKKTNDAIRGKGSYDEVLKGIKKAIAKNFSCSMIYTVSAKNFHELELMENLVKNIGIKRFFIQVIGMRGNALESNDKSNDKSNNKPNNKPNDKPNYNYQVSKANWLDKIPQIAQKIAELGIIVTYPKMFLNNNEDFQCAGIIADNYFVFPNGRVYQCPLCEDFPLHSYKIKENRLIPTPKINEKDLFNLTILEGCVMNKMIQPKNLSYTKSGEPEHKIACCMLKEEITHL